MFMMKRTLLSALALVAVPAALTAQQPAAPAELPPEVMEMVTEIQEIQEQLQSIQERALEDPQVTAAQERVGETLRTAMLRLDPTLEASMERYEALGNEAARAQEAGDQTRYAEIAAEGQQIQMQFMTVQEQAMEQPEVTESIETFQTALEAQMARIDPQAQGLIARYRELEGRLMQVVGGG